MEKILTDFFEKVLDRKYNNEYFDDRVLVQKIVYIAESKGLNLGNFSFRWDERGPYSMECRLAVINELTTANNDEYEFSEFANENITFLRNITNDVENKLEWFERIASLHYLNRVERFGKSEAIKELVIRKPKYAGQDDLNERAWDFANKI